MSGAILLLRVNTIDEVENTASCATQLRKAFPGAKIVALVSPQAQARDLVESAPDIDEVLLFPLPEHAAASKSPFALGRFLSGQEIAASVLCIGDSPHLDYARPLAGLLLAPGRRYLLRREKLVPLAGARAAAAVCDILSSALWRRVRAKWNALAGCRLKPVSNRIYRAKMAARVSLFRLLARFRRADPAPLASLPVERILWVRLDHIGDILLARPAYLALRRRYPHAIIDAVAHPVAVPLLANEPGIRQVFPYTTGQFRRGHKAPSALRTILQLRRNHYDLAVETRGDDSSRVLAFLAGARRIAGPAVGPYESPSAQNCSFLLTDPVAPARMPRLPCHASDISLALLEELGLVLPGREASRSLLENGAENEITRKLAEFGIDRPFAVIHAAPSADYKGWQPKRFAQVADYLVSRYGFSIVLTGTQADRALNAKIGALAEARDRVVDVSGMFGLLELPSLYRMARLVVSVDTGPMHIAAGVGTPTVALILSWIAPIFHPYGQADGVVHSPVPEDLLTIDDPDKTDSFLATHGERQLEAVSLDQVIDAIDRKLARPVEAVSAVTPVSLAEKDCPFVSVIVPTYNCADKLAKSLDSVLAQTGAAFEIFIMDGASTDATVDAIRSYAKLYPDKIRWVSEKDNGVYDAMNKGIDLARGRYLYFLGAGDLVRAGAFEKIRQIAPESGMALLYGNAYHVSRDETYKGEVARPYFVHNNLCHQAIFYERTVFDLVGKYETRYRVLADWVLNMRCFRASAIRKIYVDTIIADYEGGGLSEPLKDEAFWADHQQLVSQILGVRTMRERPFFVVERLLAEKVKSSRNGVGRRFWHAQLWLLHKLVRPLLPSHLRTLNAETSLNDRYIIKMFDES